MTHQILDETFRKDFSVPEFRSVLLSPIKYFYVSTIVMSRFFIITAVVYVLGPVIAIIIQLSKGVTPIKFYLPFHAKYPWNPRSSPPIYVLHYIMESMTSMGAGCVIVSVDSALGFYIFQIATQFRVLAHRMSSVKSTDDHHALIREFVLRRRILSKCCDTLERIYGPILLWSILTSALTLCANIYQMSKMSSESIVTSGLYIIVKLLQTSFFGWIGTFLTSETESFRAAAYSSGWPGSGEIPFMTNILIMLMWQPRVLTALSFSTVSMDMFVAILNTSLSYFFLLKTLEQGK